MAAPTALLDDLLATTQVTVTSLAAVVNGLESLLFTGAATVKSRLAADPDFGNPSLVLQFDLTGITALGLTTLTRYVLTTQEFTQLPLAPNAVVEFDFPVAPGLTAALSAVRLGRARFAFNVDTATGALSAISATLTTI